MAQGKSEKKTRRPSSKLTALLLVILLLGIGVQLYHMSGQLDAARREEANYARRLSELQLYNEQLQQEIDHSGDEEMIEDFARDELGMARTDEKIFRFGN